MCWHRSSWRRSPLALRQSLRTPGRGASGQPAGRHCSPHTRKKPDSRSAELGPAHQRKTKFCSQPGPPSRKLAQASYSHPSGGRQKKQELQNHGLQNENHDHRELTKLTTWTTALCNLMKLGAMPYRATQDGWVMVDSPDKMWSTGEGNGKPLQDSCLENPMNNMKRQKDRTLKDELSRSAGPICH